MPEGENRGTPMKFDHLVYRTLTGPIPVLVGGAMLVFGPKPPNDLVLSSLSEATGFAPITLFKQRVKALAGL